MPNHVHLVIKPIVENLHELINKRITVERFAESLTGEAEEINNNERNSVSLCIVSKILQDLKKFTARECNKILNRSGGFW
jgi:hypothetical protein